MLCGCVFLSGDGEVDFYFIILFYFPGVSVRPRPSAARERCRGTAAVPVREGPQSGTERAGDKAGRAAGRVRADSRGEQLEDPGRCRRVRPKRQV